MKICLRENLSPSGKRSQKIWQVENSINNTVSFISSKDEDDDDDEEHVMHSKSDTIEIMINDEANEVIK